MESLAASWGGGGSNSVQSQSRSLGVEVCRAPGCTTQRTCLWHRFVYMYPQYVVWEPLTKTVQLQKHEQSSSFGFKYKVKKYDGSAQDGSSAEMFALVTEVAAGGVAWMLLFAGDWIRSINGTPVNTPEEAFFGADFRNLSSLRLVIQRPQRLMARGVAKLRPLAASLGISLHIPPPAPGPANNVNDANAASPALDSVSTYHVSRDAAMGVVDRGGPGADDAMGVGGGRTRNSFDPLLDRYPRMGQSPGEHIPLASLSRPPVVARGLSASDRCPLPQARVVVCGAHGSAANFARGLLAENSAWGVNLDPDAPVQSFQLSLRCDGCSVGGGGADPGTRVWSSQRACLTSLVKEWESRGGGGVECGGASSRCVNVELYVVNDEEFFHHCCPWMLPSASLLVLTFDVDKLLNQPQMETSRLASMTHTLQACAGYAGSVASASPSSSSSSTSSQILLYGVPSGSQRDVSAEEVQVMFYVTDLGSQLLEQYGLAVSIAVPTCPRSMAAARQAVFAACEGRLSTAPRCVSRVVDALCGGACGVKMFGGEMSGLVCQALGGDCEPAVVQCIVECLVDAGCLLPCGSSSSSSSRRPPSRETAEMQSDFLVPFHAFQALASLLGKSSLDACSIDIRQKWFKLISTGRLSRSELTDLLASEASPLTVEILEQLGIVYMMQATSSSLSSRVDSGFAEDARCEFVIPYFLQDDCGSRREEGDDEEGEGGGGRRGEGFVLRFKHAVSWRVYFEVLCNLSALPATEEVRVLGRCRAVVRHNRLRLALHWRREAGCDGLLVTVSRAQQSGGWGEKRGFRQELERLFGYFIPPTLPFMVQAVDSTSPTSRLPSRNCHSAAPVTPVLRPPCMDGPQEETYIKPVLEVEGEGQGGSGAYSNLPLTVLPWSVLNHTAMLLTIAMPTGHDWKSVAERAGKKMVEIYAYEAIPSREVPAMSFLREWILTGTVQQFLDILESLDRPDVRDLILNYLQGRNDKS